MSKSTEEMMFGAESRAAVAKAVQDAVKRADAAGLVPAFQPYTDLSKHLRKEELLALRRAELAKLKKEPQHLKDGCLNTIIQVE